MLLLFDAFYDAPVGGNNAAITAYAVIQSNDYGKDYMLEVPTERAACFTLTSVTC